MAATECVNVNDVRARDQCVPQSGSFSSREIDFFFPSETYSVVDERENKMKYIHFSFDDSNKFAGQPYGHINGSETRLCVFVCIILANGRKSDDEKNAGLSRIHAMTFNVSSQICTNPVSIRYYARLIDSKSLDGRSDVEWTR